MHRAVRLKSVRTKYRSIYLPASQRGRRIFSTVLPKPKTKKRAESFGFPGLELVVGGYRRASKRFAPSWPEYAWSRFTQNYLKKRSCDEERRLLLGWMPDLTSVQNN
jgi:hypothetical protein